jgi:hypothetical protein
VRGSDEWWCSAEIDEGIKRTFEGTSRGLDKTGAPLRLLIVSFIVDELLPKIPNIYSITISLFSKSQKSKFVMMNDGV